MREEGENRVLESGSFGRSSPQLVTSRNAGLNSRLRHSETIASIVELWRGTFDRWGEAAGGGRGQHSVSTLILPTLNLIGYAILAVAAVRPRTAYDIRWWATAFPLGMTSVATYSTGTALHVPALHTLGALLPAVAVAAWLITLAALLAESLSSRKS
ncbi:hypothetical protein [Nocardia sp. NPDC127526]|uniref:SLAC1 family transporter n=1 Tax=Nocardia sp. NPDC127526 TaxID=3345393 RepID=UPI00363F3A33